MQPGSFDEGPQSGIRLARYKACNGIYCWWARTNGGLSSDVRTLTRGYSRTRQVKMIRETRSVIRVATSGSSSWSPLKTNAWLVLGHKVQDGRRHSGAIDAHCGYFIADAVEFIAIALGPGSFSHSNRGPCRVSTFILQQHAVVSCRRPTSYRCEVGGSQLTKPQFRRVPSGTAGLERSQQHHGGRSA